MKLQRPVGNRARSGLDTRQQALGLLPGMLGSHGKAVSRGEAGVALRHVRRDWRRITRNGEARGKVGTKAQIRELSWPELG